MKSLFLLIFAVVSLSVQAQTLEDILKDPLRYDNKEVIVRGEAIGEPLRAEEGEWVNISYQEHNIGVFFKEKNLVEKINNFGSYKRRGDLLELKGIFYAHCRTHLQRDFHALSLRIIEKGMPLKENISAFKIQFSLVLAIICLVLGVIYFIKIKYGRRD